ncbi:MAG: STAS domain-containing protein [Psychrobacillus psychrodurans]
MGSLTSISDYIFTHKEELANDIVERVVNSVDMEIPHWEQEQAVNMYIEFLSFLGEYTLSGEEKIPESLVTWSKKNAAMVSLDDNLSTLVVRYLPTRNIITDLLTNLAIKFDLSLLELGKLIKQVNRMLDISINETVVNFEQLASEYQRMSQMELAKVGTPIVPVKEGIIVLPLVGHIDTYRINYMIEHLTPKIATSNVIHAIVDFSGVYKIEKGNITYINQLIQMVRLMGINIIATGVTPSLAKLTLTENIDVSANQIYPNLKIALESME